MIIQGLDLEASWQHMEQDLQMFFQILDQEN
jgi:hypothetical protein